MFNRFYATINLDLNVPARPRCAQNAHRPESAAFPLKTFCIFTNCAPLARTICKYGYLSLLPYIRYVQIRL